MCRPARALGLRLALWCSLLTACCIAGLAHAQPLVVAVKQAPPFAERTPDGNWGGTSIELWRQLADALGREYRFHETDLEDMLAGVADGRYDVAVAAITVTAEREQRVDFTHPFYTTGLAIATAPKPDPIWQRVIATVWTQAFAELIAALALIQLVVGSCVWLVERRKNSKQFPAATGKGILAGFWWATVTMTTVGYGDEVPRTPVGRLIGLVWMLVSMVLIASVTATIASSLTVEQLDRHIGGPDDLHRFEVGTIAATTGEQYAAQNRLVSQSYADGPQALEALRHGAIEALVWDAPMLRQAAREHPDIALVPGVFARQDYAIAVREGSPLRESINRILPEKVQSVRFDAPR